MNVTKTQVVKQLDAMKSDRFEVGVYDPNDGDSGKMEIKIYNHDLVIKSLKYLRYKNFNGCHIFIRPERQNGLIFFDDLSRGDLDKLYAMSVSISVCIQSSPLNFQGWIQVSEAGFLTNDESTSISQYVAKAFGGDLHSADWRHFGRLAGFTNCKPKYVDETGKYPFCKLDDVSFSMAKGNHELREKGLSFHKEKIEKEAERLENLKNRIVTSDDSELASNIYRSILNKIRTNKTETYNASRADWAAVCNLVSRGFSIESITTALIKESEKANRPGIDSTKYVETTINKAFGL